MTARQCDWAWMAEVLDNGGLRDDARASFERHAASCAICQRVSGELVWLRQRMAALPEPTVSDFDHRRERDRLLGRAERLHRTAPQREGSRSLRLALGAVCLLVSGVAGMRLTTRYLTGHAGERDRRAEQTPPVAAPVAEPPRYEVTGLAHGAWSTEEVGGTARIVLSDGSAAFHVHRLAPGQRFLVTLPDGEIEVRGTRFVVDVEHQRTRYVVVMDGKVAFRHAGAPEALLLGGQRWDSPQAGAAAAARAETLEPAAAPAAIETPVTHLHHRAKTRIQAKAKRSFSLSRSRSPAREAGASSNVSSDVSADAAPDVSPGAALDVPPGASADHSSASQAFAEGMRAFRAARYDEADARWREFLAGHPDDSRAEDAAFLRIVGRSRSHDPAGAAELARQYLSQFPHGLRRHEAQVIEAQVMARPAP